MNMEPFILFEDAHVIVVDKPHGLQVEKDKFDHPSLQDEMEKYLDEKYDKIHFLGIVHRIDRPVCGVVVLAKNRFALRTLNKQVEERKWKKIYRASVQGKMATDQGILENYLLKDEMNKRAVISETPVNGAKRAMLVYKTIEKKADTTILDIELVTGRYHQIRAQMGFKGNPVVGDKLYGSTIELENKILLQAFSIEFFHPKTGEKMIVHSKYKLEV